MKKKNQIKTEKEVKKMRKMRRRRGRGRKKKRRRRKKKKKGEKGKKRKKIKYASTMKEIGVSMDEKEKDAHISTQILLINILGNIL